ncbi:MAG: DNA internalization-related competence protein ComEC/Rec2 [Thermodesulfovibrionales bacterium]|jgi:competence protein ComEC
MAWFASFFYGVSGFFLQRYYPLITIVLSLLLLFFLRRMGWRSLAIVLFIGLCGFLYAGHFYSPAYDPSLLAGKSMEIEAEPVSLARNPEGKGSFSQAIRVIAPREGPGEMRLITPFPLVPGRVYRLSIDLSRDAALLNPGSSGEIPVAYLREMGRSKEGSSPFPFGYLKRQRTGLNAFMKDNLSPESAPFIMSIVTGERGLIPREMRDSFSSTGLAHILSISGAHFGLLLFVVFRSARAIIRRLPYAVLVRLTTFFSPDQCAAIITIPFIVSYLGISSLNVPAIRAFIMVSLFLAGLLVQRQGFWLNTLFFAAAVILIISPEAVLDLSFQLSFVSVLAIGLASERWIRKEPPSPEEGAELPQHPNPVISYLSASLIISLAATIATAPLVAWQFHYLSLVSPLANLVFTPLIGFVILPLALFGSFCYLIFGAFPFLSLLDSITLFVLSGIDCLSRWEWSAMKIPAYPLGIVMAFYAGMGLYLLMNYRGEGKGRRLLSFSMPVFVSILPLLVCLFISLFREKGLEVTHLDVGQGDGAVVELPDGRIIVVDTGRKGFQVEAFLRYRGITEIAAIALSHAQSDHAGGALRLMREFRIREVWDNGRLIYPGGLPEGIRHRPLQRGDTILGRGYRITALHPYVGFYTSRSSEDEENNDSLVLKIEGRKNSFLFAGDIEEEAEENISCLGKYLDSDILKVPHHGSRSSASVEFIHAVSPRLAVISVGRENPYGHPHEETLRLLSSAEVLRTDRGGAVGIRELADGRLAIQRWEDFRLKAAASLRDEWFNIKKLFLVW